jgi:transglutaminase-like putative cysteine protease
MHAEMAFASASKAIPQTLSRLDPWLRTIYPLGAVALSGIGFAGDELLAIDAFQGYLLRIDPLTDSATILNSQQVEVFAEARGLAIAGETIWFARQSSVYFCDRRQLVPQHFFTIPYDVDGVAVGESTVYLASKKAGYIYIFEQATRRLITRLALPGVGISNLALRGEELWVCDRTEQTVFCLDRATGDVQFSIMTPFECPTGLAFHNHPETGAPVLYVSYAIEEPYVRDNPNDPDSPYELSFQDRTFIHPLHFRYNAEHHYTLSNGYLIEMIYAEELQPLEEVQLEQAQWRIALPTNTDRQTVLGVEAIGLPFTEELQGNQRVAVFKFDTLKPNEHHIFGWKALLAVHGIRYRFTYDDVDKTPPLSAEMQATYLVDDDELAMDTSVIREAAQAAVGTETNILRKVLRIRNYVYDRLSYSLTTAIDTPDVVLTRGIGSCGEYVGLLLALLRLNGIACRTVGRYKCPKYPEQHHLPLEPQYNHVWIEFYLPGYGWLPMESNPDDIGTGPYPTRFFMGLPWYHAEIAKGIPFQRLTTPNGKVDVSIGELAINHVRFTILGELAP